MKKMKLFFKFKKPSFSFQKTRTSFFVNSKRYYNDSSEEEDIDKFHKKLKDKADHPYDLIILGR